MATLSAGSSVTVTVDIGQTLYVKGNAEVFGLGAHQVLNGEGRYGPYEITVQLTVRAITMCVYYENYIAEGFNHQTLISDDGEEVIGLKNPSGSDTLINHPPAIEEAFGNYGKAKATSWELRGLPEDYHGLIFFRDVGIGGSFWYSDGFGFFRTSPITLAVFSNLAFDQTDTTEKVLARYYMMGGLMGANGELVFEAFLSTANSANAKTLRIKAGSDSAPSNIGSTAPTTIASTNIYHRWANVASQSSQIYYPSISAPFSTTTSALSTSAVVTSSDFWIHITGQLANIADTATVNKLIITLR